MTLEQFQVSNVRTVPAEEPSRYGANLNQKDKEVLRPEDVTTLTNDDSIPLKSMRAVVACSKLIVSPTRYNNYPFSLLSRKSRSQRNKLLSDYSRSATL